MNEATNFLKDNMETLIPILSVIISGILTWIITKESLGTQLSNLKSTLNRTEEQLKIIKESKQKLVTSETNLKKNLTQEIAKSKTLDEKYTNIREKLQNSRIVNNFYQTVVLCGPRSVGKTSLMMQLHAPWDYSKLSPTIKHRRASFPVCTQEGDKIPHFADSSIKVKSKSTVSLDIHDFPGELSYQKRILEFLNDEADKDFGIVLICMFDAEEAYSGISKSTDEYYNGDLFKQLRKLISFKLEIVRLIFVFNKFDILKTKFPSKDNSELLDKCIKEYSQILRLFSGIVNPEKVCEILTILGREDIMIENMGATIVKGEASREIIKKVLGNHLLTDIIEKPATTKSIKYLDNL